MTATPIARVEAEALSPRHLLASLGGLALLAFLLSLAVGPAGPLIEAAPGAR